MAMVDWDDAQKQSFLTMQFTAQHQYYQENYKEAAFQVIIIDELPAGRLYIAHWPDQIRIVDIALLPEFRNAGIGTALMKSIMSAARQLSLPITIHVEQFNPALRFYDRLGFSKIGEVGVYNLMKWSPSSGPGDS